MKKADRKRLDEALDKALAPPKQKPKQSLDALLEEYDDGQQPELVAEAGIPVTIPAGIPVTIPAGIPEDVPTPEQPPAVLERRVESDENEPISQLLDATHTASEKIIYSLMYRETISKKLRERHFGPAELLKKSGIRSRNTIHKAIYGLREKLSIEVLTEALGNPLGPRYRVYTPREIEQRRRTAGVVIDVQTKRLLSARSVPGGIPAGIPEGIPDGMVAGIPSEYPKNWEGGIPNFGIPGIPKFGIVINKEEKSFGELNDTSNTSSSKSAAPAGDDDDEGAFAELLFELREAVRGATGKDPSASERHRWKELGKLLAAELQAIAERTTVSSPAALLTEHVRRRLRKHDPAATEGETRPESTPDFSQCPDCEGKGYYFPDPRKPETARCDHPKLKEQEGGE